MPGSLSLAIRVIRAERLWADGDSAAAYEDFRDLFRDIVLARRSVALFGEDEFVVTQRYADLAAETGRAAEALDLYQTLQRGAAEPETRAGAGFKRLYLAVEAGEALASRAAYDSIWSDIGVEEPPLDASAAGLAAWEAGFGWRETERATLFAIAYLALGRLCDASRRLAEAQVLLERGLWHAERGAGRVARLSAIPLRLALARVRLAMGRFDLCRADLDAAGEAIRGESLAAVYGVWLESTRAKLALTEGRFGDALASLAEVRKRAVRRGLDRASASALVAQAEILILLNELTEAEACLAEAEERGRAAADPDIAAQAARARFLCAERSRMFAPAPDAPAPGGPLPGAPVREEIVWAGDCLRDFERREATVYAALDRDRARARDGLRALWGDFENAESPLIHARLRALAGLLFARSGDDKRAADYLDQARTAFREIGAERELYQATAYLIFAIEKADPERYSRLIEENDLRLARLDCALTPEQRNAFRLNKYTAAEQNARVKMDGVLVLRTSAAHSAWPGRLIRRLRYWTGLHEWLRALDEERQGRWKTRSLRASAGAAGFLGMLRRVALHPRRTATVSYTVLPDWTFVCWMRRWSMDCAILPLGRPQVARLVLTLRESLFSPARLDRRPFDELAQQAAETLGLEAVIGSLPRRITTLSVIPDDHLRRLPYCALRHRRRDGVAAYLIEDFALNVDEVTERRGTPPAARRAVAGYAERGLKDAAAAGRGAADCLSREWGLDCTATDSRRAFLSELPGSALIYYFGHGHFHAAEPGLCGLEFRDDGAARILSFADLDPCDCAGMRQALLFACLGSEAEVFPGRWAVSLPEILLRRGARSVLAAMWLLDQSVAKRASEQFLQNARKGRAACLARIQRGLIAERRDPYTWAALHLYGEAGPLKL